ncbi:MAG: mechanosensitive ion channel family protein [Paludibacteraceae bacterium]|nr:mechanosensitive ion channel family protein [Paludibacteraceae bacterium]
MAKRLNIRVLVVFVSLCLWCGEAYAVFNEKSFGQTVGVLKEELRQEYRQLQRDRIERQKGDDLKELQRKNMVEMTRRCNELELMLYSQDEGFTFDQTYAMSQVFRQYFSFRSLGKPNYGNIDVLDNGIDRYKRLYSSLTELGKSNHNNLTEEAMADLDTCVYYVSLILGTYQAERRQIRQDSIMYANMRENLSDAFEYAKTHYSAIQKEIYVTGQDGFLTVVTSLPSYWRQVKRDCGLKYSSTGRVKGSRWRGGHLLTALLWHLVFLGIIVLLSVAVVLVLSHKLKRLQTERFRMVRPLVTLLDVTILYTVVVFVTSFTLPMLFNGVAVNLMLIFMWMLGALLLAILIGMPAEHARDVFHSFLPVILLGLFVMMCRMVFVPDRLLNLVIAPVTIVATLWQLMIVIGLRRKLSGVILTYQWVSFGMMATSAVSAIVGFIFMALQFQLYWLFQTAFLATIYALRSLLLYYDSKRMERRRQKYAASHSMASTNQKGDFIRITWLFDLLMQVVIPVCALLSVVLCVWLAAELFNLGGSFRYLLLKTLLSVGTGDDVMLEVSIFKLVSVGVLFFIFRYLNYLFKSLYRVNKYEKAMRESGQEHISKNEVNLTLANNVIGIVFWGLFAIYAVILLKIPVGALSAIVAGLAAGIGLAMKDVLNNFIYGIQLMSGRVRVGDMIECDGVRGIVTRIAYQSTDIQTIEGPVVSFTNTTLFNLNFKNITKNTPYEFTKITVGISYNSDIDRVRRLLMKALQGELEREDAFGRKVLDPEYGIKIAFDEFRESSVQIAIKQNVRPECQIGYKTDVKELVFKLFRENGIEIPFNQMDVTIKK